MYILLQVQNVIAYGLCYSRYDLLPSLARVSMATFITFPLSVLIGISYLFFCVSRGHFGEEGFWGWRWAAAGQLTHPLIKSFRYTFWNCVVCMSLRFDSAVAVCLIYAFFSIKIVSLDCSSQQYIKFFVWLQSICFCFLSCCWLGHKDKRREGVFIWGIERCERLETMVGVGAASSVRFGWVFHFG